jgi:hypothetical protein
MTRYHIMLAALIESFASKRTAASTVHAQNCQCIIRSAWCCFGSACEQTNRLERRIGWKSQPSNPLHRCQGEKRDDRLARLQMPRGAVKEQTSGSEHTWTHVCPKKLIKPCCYNTGLVHVVQRGRNVTDALTGY